MKRLVLALTLLAQPVLAQAVPEVPGKAAEKPFFSLSNTDFVVLIAFLVFVGILLYFRVPQRVIGMLDGRAAQIRADLDEARTLRDEAKALLASYERKRQEVQAQSDRIVANARDEAVEAARLAKEELTVAIARRLAAATDRIASAEMAAVREVREQAVNVAVAAAADVLARQATPEAARASVDAALDQVAARLN